MGKTSLRRGVQPGMNRALSCALLLLLVGPMSIPLLQAAAVPWDWKRTSPERQGLSSRKLEALKDSLAARNQIIPRHSQRQHRLRMVRARALGH